MTENKHPKIVVVMPAYNAEKTLKATVDSIPKSLNAEILLVDDASRDKTVARARELGLKVVSHEKNIGYGGNQKTCYRSALEMGAEIVVMIHPDYQYDGRLIPALILPIELGVCDVMLGNRIRTRDEALSGGMPAYKYIANRGLTLMENFLLGQNLGEFHSGMRAYNRKTLETIRWETNSDDFVFDQQFLIQCAYHKLRMGDVPVPAKYFAEASSINFRRSTQYGLEALVVLGQYYLAKLGIVEAGIFKPKTR